MVDFWMPPFSEVVMTMAFDDCMGGYSRKDIPGWTAVISHLDDV
jgi:hypothetical protein